MAAGGGAKGDGLGRIGKALAAAALSSALAACAHAPKLAQTEPPPCLTGGERATAELVFARIAGETPGPGVSESEFARFINDEIVSRFHDGLTVLDAQDLAPRPDGGAFYGPAKVVMIVLPGRPDDGAQLDAIRVAYRRRFNQQSVIEMTHQACVSL
ncbi:MAG: DUF3574 domain-containing protein [Caulobacteraceae bacterium]|nr:DUF3574 domain-containing protein [Caulobacteraceae bacterium]